MRTVDRSALPVRLVVLNHDGGDLTLRCLEQLMALDWPADRLELVCLDNASSDGSPDRIAARFPQVELRRLSENSGFTANNVALDRLDEVRYVGLVNNDAFVEPDWLTRLVGVMDADRGIGAACPKIVLEPRFCSVAIRSGPQRPGRGDRREVGVRVRRVEVDGRDVTRAAHLGPSGWGREADASGTFEWSRPEAELRVPAPTASGPFELALTIDAPGPTRVTVDGGGGIVEAPVSTAATTVVVRVDGPRADVVNNVGSVIRVDGYGEDRGWLEFDRGQFDDPVDVDAWCGGGVLLRPEYLVDVGVFDPVFFLYYEDTDLSWRGSARGWRYRTVPSAVMRHVHAASTGEGSTLSRFLTERNRLVMLARNAPVRSVVSQFTRFPLSTVSYARRDVLARLVSGRRPETTTVVGRCRSYLAALRLLPSSLAARRSLRRRSLVTAR